MKIITFKPGTKIRTKKHKRGWATGYLNKEGVVIGASPANFGMIRVILNEFGGPFDVYPEEIELIKPFKLKRCRPWK